MTQSYLLYGLEFAHLKLREKHIVRHVVTEERGKGGGRVLHHRIYLVMICPHLSRLVSLATGLKVLRTLSPGLHNLRLVIQVLREFTKDHSERKGMRDLQN